MKNIIISLMGSYIFWFRFCEVKNPAIPVIVFFLCWGIAAEIEEQVNDFKKSLKRGEKLNDQINRIKGERYV